MLRKSLYSVFRQIYTPAEAILKAARPPARPPDRPPARPPARPSVRSPPRPSFRVHQTGTHKTFLDMFYKMFVE